MHQTTSRLRSVLLEFYPQALQAFPNLKHKAALTVLTAANTPQLGSKLTAGRIVALLHRCGRRNDPALVEQILTDLTTAALRQPAVVEAALGTTVVGLLGIITAMHAAVEQLEAALAVEFEQHPLAPVLRSMPGLGPVLAGRGITWGMTISRLRSVKLRVGDADWTERISPHGLRHSAATRMLEEGIPIGYVAAVLGHEDQTVTAKVYSHVRPTSLRG